MITIMNNTPTHTSLRHSRQRDEILALLRSTTIHPTADWIYQEMKRGFPHLSLGTVYRNLAILVEQGLVRKLESGSTFDRFEARMEPHYHLICSRCGAVNDFDLPVYEEINERAGRMTDFQIQGHKIEFFGLCSACRAQKP